MSENNVTQLEELNEALWSNFNLFIAEKTKIVFLKKLG